jgi:purine-binding chemotaxis protein CheW
MAEKDAKYLTFELANEGYAIPILKVKEIIGMMEITQVPKLPSFIKGVINLRGKIIPIIDLRLKFGLEERDYDERTSIIVVELETENTITTSGIVVDNVQEVLDIKSRDIEPPPQYGTDVEQSFLTGMGKVKDDVIMLLNVDRILSAKELQKIEKI